MRDGDIPVSQSKNIWLPHLIPILPKFHPLQAAQALSDI
jgi:hypothetical protein